MTKLSDAILRLHDEGKSYRQIQSALGCSKGTIAYHVGAGQKDKTIQRQRDRRGEVKKYIQSIKQESVCTDCKENYPFWIMEFDHLGDKEFNICAWYNSTGSLEKVRQEIEKCEVVCANCHRNRTHSRGYKNGSNSLDISGDYTY